MTKLSAATQAAITRMLTTINELRAATQAAITRMLTTINELRGIAARLTLELQSAHDGIDRKHRQIQARDDRIEFLEAFIESHQLDGAMVEEEETQKLQRRADWEVLNPAKTEEHRIAYEEKMALRIGVATADDGLAEDPNHDQVPDEPDSVEPSSDD